MCPTPNTQTTPPLTLFPLGPLRTNASVPTLLPFTHPPPLGMSAVSKSPAPLSRTVTYKAFSVIYATRR